MREWADRTGLAGPLLKVISGQGLSTMAICQRLLGMEQGRNIQIWPIEFADRNEAKILSEMMKAGE